MVRLLVGALLLGVTATAASAQAPPPLDTSGWKIFRDATMGSEVKAPPTWGVGRTTGTMESVLLGRREMTGAFGKHFDFYTTLNKSDIFQVSIIQDSPREPLDRTFDAVISTVKFVE